MIAVIVLIACLCYLAQKWLSYEDAERQREHDRRLAEMKAEGKGSK